jgi:hypothetical protein
MDQFRIILSNFRYVPIRKKRALRFDLTWEYDQPGLHLSTTSEGCLAYADCGKITWHYNKTSIGGAWVTTQLPNPELVDWVRDRLEESGVMKTLIADEKLRREAELNLLGDAIPNIDEIRGELSHGTN